MVAFCVLGASGPSTVAASGAVAAVPADKNGSTVVATSPAPRIFSHDPAVLVRKKARSPAERKADPVLACLFDAADKALREKPFSVVEKTTLPPSGDRHDYLSLAPYAWPDPRRPSGLPYLIRDGEINPERDRIPDHKFDPDGQQPAELRRTRAWHYAAFNLQALVLLANLGERVGVDLWRYQTPDGRSIRIAMAWLLPFALGEKPWGLHDIGGMTPGALGPPVREAAAALEDNELAAAAAKLNVKQDDYLDLFME
jgi:hypothetical protein